jgi:hypothetical protein
MPKGGLKDREPDQLLDIVRMQLITRRRAREATQNESPWNDATSELKKLVMGAQESDPFTRRVQKELRESAKGDLPSEKKKYSISKEGLLLYKERLYIPEQRSLIYELLQLYHGDPLAGHWGVTKTVKLIERKFRWKGLKKDMEEYIKTCPVCQGLNVIRYKPYGKL